MKRILLAAFGLAIAAGLALAANDLTLSTGTKFLAGPRLIDGNDLNVMLGAVNDLRDQVDGTKSLPLCTGSGATPITCNGAGGRITTVALTTAAVTDNADIVINDNVVTANSAVTCAINAYATYGAGGDPIVMGCLAGTGTITLKIRNTHATNALNGTLGVGFRVTN
jgi:hypothetical protein